MNNHRITELLGGKELEKNFIVDAEYVDIQWRVQDSSERDLLFFKGNHIKYKKELLDRKIGVCFVDSQEVYNELEGNKVLLKSNDWLNIQNSILNDFYPVPNNLNIIGVTGTNGKSTVVKFIEQIFLMNKESIVTCGTLGLFINGEKASDFFLTTPSFIDCRKILYKYKNIKNFAFEVSSHALSQERFYKIPFNQIGWTSFSQDHLDYHKTMEEYFNEKLKLKNYSLNPFCIPAREEKLKELLNDHDFQESPLINVYPPVGLFSVTFNKSNYELALDLSQKSLNRDLNIELGAIETVPGRFQIYSWKDNFFIVDYAHTPDALINICSELKKSYENYELITVFGCGGDRDRDKRPKMAEAVEAYSDKIILTSDNPRFEDPVQIVNDAQKGFKNQNNHLIIVDRKEAITKSFELINRPSVVLVAGKGHENYLDIKGVKHEYSDASLIMELIESRND